MSAGASDKEFEQKQIEASSLAELRLKLGALSAEGWQLQSPICISVGVVRTKAPLILEKRDGKMLGFSEDDERRARGSSR